MEMDRPSIAFAKFLETVAVESLTYDESRTELVLTCTECAVRICDVEDGDDLRLLLNTALAHSCDTGKARVKT